MKYHTILLIMTVFPSMIECQKTCSRISDFQPLVFSIRLQGYTFESKSGLGLRQCVDECSRRRRCMSVNYKSSEQLCELNRKAKTNLTEDEDYVYSDIAGWKGKLSGVCSHHSCPANSVCRDVDGRATCDVIYCDISTANKSIGVKHDKNADGLYMDGERVAFACGRYSLASDLVCGREGMWEGEMKCIRFPANCKAVKTCNISAEEGYYWIMPLNANNTALRVFCPFGKSSNYATYIKLNDEYNFSVYPGKDLCNETSQFCGKTRFQAVHFYLTSFTIGNRFGRDETVNSCGYKYSRLGWAGSCSECEEDVGSFRINTTGTGFIVAPSVTWTHATVTRQNDNRVVTGRCHGGCKLCRPDGQDESNRVPVVLDPNYQPPRSSAMIVECPHDDENM